MARFHGIVGYVHTKEIRPGVWEEETTERYYYGDIFNKSSSWVSSGNRIDNIELKPSINIVADPYARENYMFIRYVKYENCLWNVTKSIVQYPRIELTLGGVYTSAGITSGAD